MDEGVRTRIDRHAAIAVATLSFVGYFVVARTVGNVYPFSTFPMYAGEHGSTGSRIVAKDEAQGLHEVSDGVAWTCEDTPDGGSPIEPTSPGLDPYACAGGGVYAITYVDRAAIDHVRTHWGSDPRARPVELVRHIWTFPDDRGPPTTSDCHMASCRAVLHR